MTKEAMHKILDLYDRAMEDPEYMTLHAEYAPVQRTLAELLERLPAQERKIIEVYLNTSVELFNRLLEIALSRGNS